MLSSDCDNKRLTTKNLLWWSPSLLSAIIYYHQIIWPHTQSQLQIIFCACLVSDHETTHIHYICVCCKRKAPIMGLAWICMPSKCFCALVKMFEEWSASRWHMWLKCFHNCVVNEALLWFGVGTFWELIRKPSKPMKLPWKPTTTMRTHQTNLKTMETIKIH